MTKPNCYNCKHRGDLPGDAHSCCRHPKNDGVMNDPLAQLFAIFASVGRVPAINAETGLHVVGDPHGIRNGWFNWPMNFDPIWLVSCDGFAQKGGSHEKTKRDPVSESVEKPVPNANAAGGCIAETTTTSK